MIPDLIQVKNGCHIVFW